MLIERLIGAMELRGMTQKQLALKAHVSGGHISRILSAEKEPGVKIAAQLAAALDVSLDWLCGLPERTPGALAPDEDELLKLYQELPAHGKRAALGSIKSLRNTLGEPLPDKRGA